MDIVKEHNNDNNNNNNTSSENIPRRTRADSYGTPTNSNILNNDKFLENNLRHKNFEKDLFSLISSQTKLMTSVKTRHRMMEMMENYTNRLGMTEEIKKLKVVHVAGTKGKGSTCAFVESILRRHGLKTGLFTSPHLIDVTERFRINGVPIDRESLYKAFYDVWDRLHDTVDDAEDFPPIPVFFRFLTLVGFKIFSTLQTDVVVLEVGMGGRLDATNICKAMACGITPLDLDHTRVLGDTIDKIAYEKSGIMKLEGVPCFTGINHDPKAMEVIKDTAKRVNCPLHIVRPLNKDNVPKNFLGLNGDHQRENAALAIELSEAFMNSYNEDKKKAATDGNDNNNNKDKLISTLQCRDVNTLSENVKVGLNLCKWAGRTQIIDLGKMFDGNEENDASNLIFYLDGAHTPKSLQCCTKWYSQILAENEDNNNNICNVLIFNCSRDRRIDVMFPELLSISNCKWEKIIFCPADYSRPTTVKLPTPKDVLLKIDQDKYATLDPNPKVVLPEETKDFRWQHIMKDVWDVLAKEKGYGESMSMVCPSVKDAIEHVKNNAKSLKKQDVKVLLSGSLYLVGSALNYFGPQYI